MGDAAPIEIFWCLLSAAACTLHALITTDALAAIRSLRRAQANGALMLTARSTLWVAALLGTAQGFFFLLGLRSTLTPSPTPSGDPSFEAVVLIALIMGGEALMAAAAMVSWEVRRRVRDLYG